MGFKECRGLLEKDTTAILTTKIMFPPNLTESPRPIDKRGGKLYNLAHFNKIKTENGISSQGKNYREPGWVGARYSESGEMAWELKLRN